MGRRRRLTPEEAKRELAQAERELMARTGAQSVEEALQRVSEALDALLNQAGVKVFAKFLNRRGIDEQGPPTEQ